MAQTSSLIRHTKDGNDDDQRFKQATNRTYCGFEKEHNKIWRGPFFFIQAADTQYGLIDEVRYVDWSLPAEVAQRQFTEYKAKGKSEWQEEIRLSHLAITQWNQMNPSPRFVIICGDLVNDFPGMPFRASQIDDFKKTFKLLNPSIPLILLPGNHDLLNRPTSDSIEQYRAQFGDDYFSFTIDGVHCLVINTQYYKDGASVPQLAAEHEKWIEQQLDEITQYPNRYKHVLVFQHIPWFCHDVDENDDQIFNITMLERKRMLKKFNDAGVRAIFAGHYHRNGGGNYENLELIVTSAMGAVIRDPITGIQDKPGYRIVEVNEHELCHRFVYIES